MFGRVSVAKQYVTSSFPQESVHTWVVAEPLLYVTVDVCVSLFVWSCGFHSS